MATKIKLSKIMGLVLVVFPLLATAATNAKMEMSKDEWLSKIKEIVPEPICKGFMQDETIASRLKARNIDLQKCIELIPGIADKCSKKFYDRLPATITQENVSKWGHSIGECIGAEFVINYVFSDTEEKKDTTADGEQDAKTNSEMKKETGN
ncbi:hypothetical protein [Legionella londiniensis]|uniref:T2SS substrate NttA domain-containing protein n=1 Tax=Legionella londiniensis TaxID=45068 RepID=A0A0W0VP93_9GAMM|nr:hypothetical protein [Legionella londiniensis]KTD21927.1 hypothetical protein Llon_1092 [Legionella londiniensis]STX92590.1 Uncharacterised protein [Legionella londiniensis]